VAERLTLDPSELTTRSSLDITDWIDQEGLDWGDAAIQTTMAEQQVGAVPVDFTIPNRTVSIPLNLMDRGGTAFASIRASVQAKAGLWQAQGGYLRRVLATGGTVFADVVNATLRLGDDWLVNQRSVDANALLTLECLPDFYEAEETLSDHTETTAAELIFTETTANGGDFPLGDRVRVVVDDDQAQNQRGLIWHFRGRHYSSASTAASAYEAEALQTLDTAAKVAKVGASGGTVVTHGTISTNWTPVVGTNIAGTSYLTHTGTNRIWARVFSTAGTAVEARFVYDVGDLVNPVENNPVTLYDGGTFHILDLGEARFDPPPSGTHRWQGQIQARGQVGTEAFSVDRIWVQNVDESAGVLRSPLTITQGLATYSARSEFNTESGALAGDTAAVGGNWAGAGDADDYTVASGVATRTSLSDADINTGRYAVLGSSVGACGVTGSLRFTSPPLASEVTQVARHGLLARYADTSNYVLLCLENYPGTNNCRLAMYKRVAGVVTRIGDTAPRSSLASINYWHRLLLTVDAAGNWFGAVMNGDLSSEFQLSGFDSVLASAGTLGSGKVGIYDAWTKAATANTRDYDDFAAWVPSADAVVFASQSAELSTKGIIREDTGGTAYGPVSVVSGDLPRIPNQSSAGTVEFLAKASRGDLEMTPDTSIDDVSARVYRRASWLTVS
jgi:hypothetical protein